MCMTVDRYSIHRMILGSMQGAGREIMETQLRVCPHRKIGADEDEGGRRLQRDDDLISGFWSHQRLVSKTSAYARRMTVLGSSEMCTAPVLHEPLGHHGRKLMVAQSAAIESGPYMTDVVKALAERCWA